jgi:hypothetical protein
MKFELNDYHRNVSTTELIADLKKVAAELKKDSVTTKEYNEYGRYSAGTLKRQFGSWNKSLEMSGLKVTLRQNIPDSEFIADLKKVSLKLKKDSVTKDEYDKHGKYGTATLSKRFGGWNKSLGMAELKVTLRQNIPEEELFENLEEVWIKLGRQPASLEIQTPLSRFALMTYKTRFGGWRKALEKFVEYINDPETEEEKIIIFEEENSETQPLIKHKTQRGVNWRLRFIVMRKDNFKCKNCGRYPATDPKTILHVDHINAWANGGETVLENLQTLCSVCNIGKSDLE